MSETTRPLQAYLVEDSPVIQQSLGDAIVAAGAQLSGCSADAQTAIADVFVLEPDLILIDLRLASGSGFDVLRTLQEHSLAPGAIKVVLTDYAQTGYRNLSAQFGADRFLEKSLEMSQALELIDAMVAERRGVSVPRHSSVPALSLA